MKKSFAYPVLYMIIITITFITVLASFNYFTIDRIVFNEENDLRHKILYVFDILPEGEDPQEIEEIFNERVIEKQFDDNPGYALMEGNDEVSYAIRFEGSGLWGSIIGYLGLNDDFTQIIGIEFITQSETPGLGGRISEEPYKEQYRDIELDTTEGKYLVSTPDGNVDAIAGATSTSVAVVNILNENLVDFFESAEVD
ncbi:FMN-binding protein [Alkalibaculum sp. M08DMB]|uniref:FMN-binding protein n=1 Tax=Alkalibaculum sporogenes TaxID=2655001 RepID=A0A6A7K807_9FIRM|nr:FMN-binding protein [Alkalibaculum sporogenes]MPW25554.1 FMN-binding protein [Alkalibaculum sporogenes]